MGHELIRAGLQACTTETGTATRGGTTDRAAPTSPSVPRKPALDAGFTLIELVVATTVMAVLSIGAVLAFGPRNTALDSQTLTRAWERERLLAITGRHWRGLAISPQGMTPMIWRAQGWQSAGAQHRWSATAALIPLGARPGATQPEITFLPDGSSTEFSISWEGAGRCTSTGSTKLSCTP